MQSVLSAIDADSHFDLSLIVCAQHVERAFGYTADEVRQAGYRARFLESVGMTGGDKLEMSLGVSAILRQVSEVLAHDRPDLLMLLGDRGEMLAGATAALYLGIPVVHFHGGERSGTVDNSIRRAVSSLSHLHFTATDTARGSLTRAGENPEMVHFVGAPGIDGIVEKSLRAGPALRERLCFSSGRDVVTLIFHPVVQDSGEAAMQARAILDVLSTYDCELVVFSPNSDAGSAAIIKHYDTMRGDERGSGRGNLRASIYWLTHLPRDEYLALIAASRVLVGNSSSGIIEAASLGTPAVNVGDRQNGRERNNSVFDCGFHEQEIRAALSAALSYSGTFGNRYDNGGCARRVLPILRQMDFPPDILKKKFTY